MERRSRLLSVLGLSCLLAAAGLVAVALWVGGQDQGRPLTDRERAELAAKDPRARVLERDGNVVIYTESRGGEVMDPIGARNALFFAAGGALLIGFSLRRLGRSSRSASVTTWREGAE